MATDANSLLTSSKCFACFAGSPYDLELIKLALLVGIVNGNTNMATDPNSLLSQAQCFACFGNNLYTLQLMEIGLLIQILQNGGAGGGSPSTLQCGNYGGGQPTFTPANGCGLAVDTSNGQTWWYYNGAWH